MTANTQLFDYEDTCMGARASRPKTYRLSFHDDYRLRSLTELLKLNNGAMLDIGCGGGRVTETLPYYFPGTKIFGCDISKSAITYAKKFGSGKVTYARINGKRLPYASASFDACICFDVLEHVPDAEFLLRDIRRVLKKNGVLILIVPCEGEPFTYTWLFTKLRIGQDLTFRFFGHIHPEFTQKKVLEMLRRNKYEIAQIRFSEHLFYQWMHVLTFFLPKILLEKVFGTNIAHAYTNSSLLTSPKRRFDPFMLVRTLWFYAFSFLMMYPMSWETILLKHVSFGAWKLHVAARKTI